MLIKLLSCLCSHPCKEESQKAKQKMDDFLSKSIVKLTVLKLIIEAKGIEKIDKILEEFVKVIKEISDSL